MERDVELYDLSGWKHGHIVGRSFYGEYRGQRGDDGKEAECGKSECELYYSGRADPCFLVFLIAWEGKC